jgi:hypothetical protein
MTKMWVRRIWEGKIGANMKTGDARKRIAYQLVKRAKEIYKRKRRLYPNLRFYAFVYEAGAEMAQNLPEEEAKIYEEVLRDLSQAFVYYDRRAIREYWEAYNLVRGIIQGEKKEILNLLKKDPFIKWR